MDVETKLGIIHCDRGNNLWVLEKKETIREDMNYNVLLMTHKDVDNHRFPPEVKSEDDVETFTMIEHMQSEVHYTYKRGK